MIEFLVAISAITLVFIIGREAYGLWKLSRGKPTPWFWPVYQGPSKPVHTPQDSGND